MPLTIPACSSKACISLGVASLGIPMDRSLPINNPPACSSNDCISLDLGIHMNLSLPNNHHPGSWVDGEFDGADDDMFEPSDLFSTSALPPLNASCLPITSPTSVSSSTSLSDAAPVDPSAAGVESPQSVPSEMDDAENHAHDVPLQYVHEENLWVKQEHNMDDISEISDLDVGLSEQSPEENASCVPGTTCSQASNGEDASMSQLDELLRLDTHEFVGDSGFPWAENLFQGQDFSLADSVGTWPLDCLPEFPPLCASSEMSGPKDEPEENVSHVFSEWLKSNAHRFSLSDLRKIKLKTSTVEAATRRLGGGKKGMMYFLKLLLIWIQNHHIKRKHSEGTKSPTLQDQELEFSSRVIDGAVNGRSSYSFSAVLDNSLREEYGQGGVFLGSAGYGTELSTPAAMQSIHPERQGCVDSLYNSRFANVKVPSGNDWSSLPSADDNAGPNSFFPACNSPVGSSFSPRIARHGTNLLHVASSPAVRNSQPFPASVVTTNLGSYAPMSDSLALRASTPAATTRAARKSRMERQRWSVRRHRRWSNLSTAADLSWPSQALGAASLNLPYRPRSSHRLSRSTLEFQQSRRAERNLRLLFQKELKQSDVGNLGRIVLPKAAETSLPPLERDGVNLVVEDMTSSKTWNMRYRFWPNNKSRMYLLENTGDFVKSYDLKEGDYMMLYTNNSNSKYVIRGAKGELQQDAACAHSKKADSDLSICNGYASMKTLATEGGAPTSSVGNCRLDLQRSSGRVIASESTCDDSVLAELIEQSLEDVSET